MDVVVTMDLQTVNSKCAVSVKRMAYSILRVDGKGSQLLTIKLNQQLNYNSTISCSKFTDRWQWLATHTSNSADNVSLVQWTTVVLVCATD